MILVYQRGDKILIKAENSLGSTEELLTIEDAEHLVSRISGTIGFAKESRRFNEEN